MPNRQSPAPVAQRAQPRVRHNYAFIDSQNVTQGIKRQGWNLDWTLFREHLRDKLGVTKALLFIGFIEGNEGLYRDLKNAGFDLVFRQTVTIRKDGKVTVKGNVDTDLVMHAMLEKSHYDGAVIASGDGDFHSLAAHLQKEGKLATVLAPDGRSASRLLRDFRGRFASMDTLRGTLERKRGHASPKKTKQRAQRTTQAPVRTKNASTKQTLHPVW